MKIHLWWPNAGPNSWAGISSNSANVPAWYGATTIPPPCRRIIKAIMRVISVSPNGNDPDSIAMQAIDAGAEDVQVTGDVIEVYTAPADLEKVKRSLEDQRVRIDSAERALPFSQTSA